MRDFRENADSVCSAILNAVTRLGEATSDLQRVRVDLETLAKLEPPSPRDPIKVRNAVLDPRGESAAVHARLGDALKFLNKLSGLEKEFRAAIETLLATQKVLD